MPPRTTTASIITRLQNRYHPEWSENLSVWQSDNQGFKEATFIKMDRRGGDMERHGEVPRDAEKYIETRRDVEWHREAWRRRTVGHTSMCGG